MCDEADENRVECVMKPICRLWQLIFFFFASVSLLLLFIAPVVDCKAKGGKSATVDRDGDGVPDDGDDAPEVSIEVVNEAKVDEILAENDRNLLVVFYDSANRCPKCKVALEELEEIDDDLEATGYIEVVKSNDKHLAKELGVQTLPALVYYRRKEPIIYDGDFDDSADVLKWVRAHEQVACVELEDDDFEDQTDSSSPHLGSLDWFVMFYNKKDEGCSSYIPMWETVAHRLKGLVNVARLDIAENDDVAERFHVDEAHECPSFILFRRGKMHKYKDSARDIDSLAAFALHRFKEMRGHRVPEPPTKIEEIYEELKEDLIEIVTENTILAACVAGAVLLVILAICACLMYRRKKEKSY